MGDGSYFFKTWILSGTAPVSTMLQVYLIIPTTAIKTQCIDSYSGMVRRRSTQPKMGTSMCIGKVKTAVVMLTRLPTWGWLPCKSMSAPLIRPINLRCKNGSLLLIYLTFILQFWPYQISQRFTKNGSSGHGTRGKDGGSIQKWAQDIKDTLVKKVHEARELARGWVALRRVVMKTTFCKGPATCWWL